MVKSKINWKVLIISLAIVYAIGFAGNIFTSEAVNSTWYESTKTSITPPNYVFPIVWNILFFLIALSIYFSWTSAKDKVVKVSVANMFGVNLFLNLMWSVLFFGFQSPLAAFIGLIFLWISTISLIILTHGINRKAMWLLTPYFAWLTFAGVLNYLIAF